MTLHHSDRDWVTCKYCKTHNPNKIIQKPEMQTTDLKNHLGAKFSHQLKTNTSGEKQNKYKMPQTKLHLTIYKNSVPICNLY